jgi:hypothetical protein
VAKRSKGAPGIYELEPGLYKVVVSLGRDGTGRYRQCARTGPSMRRSRVSLIADFQLRRSCATCPPVAPPLQWDGQAHVEWGPAVCVYAW